MSRVRIVGGGLTGILAAFEAHRLGARDIELHERFDTLGGVALPQVRHGMEIRDGCIYFGPQGDPIRSLLESYGLGFADFDNRFGSVSLGADGERVCIEDFGGPALPCANIAVATPAGPSLADRIAAYPPAVSEALTRYADWHLGWNLSLVHGQAAVPMAINRVFPTGADLTALAEAKHSDPAADELWAIPRALWGRTNNLTASLPLGGFPALLEGCRRSLEAAGVRIHTEALVSPRQALAAHAPGEVLVWAANPTPMFKAAGVPTPRLKAKSFATYVFAAEWSGPKPFYVQNFTATGVCFRVYLYESGGRTLLLAECVAEAQDRPLREEIDGLLQGFGGALELGQMLSWAVKPRWIYHTVEAIAALGELRGALAERLGSGFVSGAWEAYAKGEKFAQVNAGLARALGVSKGRAAAA